MGYFDTLKNLEGIRQRETQNALAKQAGGMLSQGDQTGARNALWRGGELDAGFKIDEGMSSSRKAQAEAMERFTTGVSRMLDDPSYANDPNGADRAWNDATQFASQLGLNPDALNQDRDAFLKNPKGWASFWNQKAKEEQFTLTPGSARYDASGKVIASQPLERRPDWRERTLPDGSTEFFDINAEAGNGNPIPGGTPGFNSSAPRPPAAPNADQAVAALTQRGARVTSGLRSPERNAAVGGSPNSYHLPSRGGVARDLVPPQGVSMAQFHAQVKAQLPPGWEAINEGDHVHIEPGASRQVAQTSAGPRTVRGDAAGGGGRMATAAEKQALGLPADQPVWMNKDGKPDLISTGAQGNPRKAEADLRKEFNARPEVKDFRDVDASYRTISRLSSQAPSAAGDMSLIFAFMKMLDPGSVVREGEFANAQNTAGIPDRIRNAYNKALNGQRLSEKQRSEFTAQARTIYGSRQERYSQIEQEYRGYASDYGLDPARISTPGATPSAPKAGDFHPKQRAKAQQLAKNPQFKSAPAGSRVRPYVPRNEAEFKSIKKDQWYVDDDGELYQKGR